MVSGAFYSNCNNVMMIFLSWELMPCAIIRRCTWCTRKRSIEEMEHRILTRLAYFDWGWSFLLSQFRMPPEDTCQTKGDPYAENEAESDTDYLPVRCNNNIASLSTISTPPCVSFLTICNHMLKFTIQSSTHCESDDLEMSSEKGANRYVIFSLPV